ncbi:S8 family serine peptidase [Blastococcus tunisiensis]|uniref:Serine protease AprX n=1 Tax=Blastococcus tunisiensis TaxID=1798228 RepID=A0A1I2K497_9ACTN|nr:S8 family serine peptidase [Blastococcus sp. DSM 46838]SFF61922.1 serine protease AprX [Blastococcus sp. DSM 46838]
MRTTQSGETSTGPPAYGVTWGGVPLHARRMTTVATAVFVVAGAIVPGTALATADAPPVSVIVQEFPGAGNAPERAVAALGGTVEEPLGIINGFSATLPTDRLGALRAAAGVRSVTEDAAVELLDAETEAVNSLSGSLHSINHEVIGASGMWDKGFTGRGVDVALIDSGVVPVDGLRGSGKVVYGPDLSFEARLCDETGCVDSPVHDLDTYGHGTHMAGIIAGRDDATPSPVSSADASNFKGVAPDARIVSIKVADAFGMTDVSQVIAAIDWVVQNRNKGGLNIRVLNLSFGTDGVQDYQLDPLTYAAEVAWHSGIVVVVAAGNGGYGTDKLNNPAHDPYVIAVGGVDGKGTHGIGDDVVPAWSSTGDGGRNPDLVAPGASVASLRAPGSYLDDSYPNARNGERFFRGSGTSQAAAVVSGAAALLVSQRPGITPDQVKALLVGTAKELPKADAIAQGNGLVDLKKARQAATPTAVQTWPRATGLGSLDESRGSAHLELDGTLLEGEFDVRGTAWDPQAWTRATTAGTSWSGEAWNGQEWYAVATDGALLELTWSGRTWSGRTWSGLTWNGRTWSGRTWSGRTWSGDSWTGRTWSGVSWTGRTWSGRTWSGRTWSGSAWSGADWN